MRAAHHRIWPGRPAVSSRGRCSSPVAARRRPCATPGATRRRRWSGSTSARRACATPATLAARHGVANLDAAPPADRGRRRARDDVRPRRVHRRAAPPRRPVGGSARAARRPGPQGAITLMVYARYGRVGVSMLQDYCRRLGVGTSPAELRRAGGDAARAAARAPARAAAARDAATSPTTTRSPTPCATLGTADVRRPRAVRADRRAPGCGSGAGSARRRTSRTAVRSARRRTPRGSRPGRPPSSTRSSNCSGARSPATRRSLFRGRRPVGRQARLHRRRRRRGGCPCRCRPPSPSRSGSRPAPRRR